MESSTTMEAPSSASDGLDARRLAQAGAWAVLGAPLVIIGITLVVGGSWRLDGADSLWMALLIAFVAASATVWAQTAPVALGLMAAEVVMVGSLFRPGGMIGAAFAAVVGMAGAWLGGAVAGGDMQPLDRVRDGAGILTRQAIGLGFIAMVVMYGVVRLVATDDNPAPAAPPRFLDACEAAALPVQASQDVKASLAWSGPDETASTGRMPQFQYEYSIGRGVRWSMQASYLTVTPAGGGPVFAQPAGRSTGGWSIGSSASSVGFNGARCGDTERVSFLDVAGPGRYVAKAIVVLDGKAWASEGFEFEMK